MKAIHWITAAAACVLSAPASAGIDDPEIIIYRFPGVLDNGGAGFTGVATVLHCTNFSGVEEKIRMVTRGASGNLLSNHTFSINHLETVTTATHLTSTYVNHQLPLDTGPVTQGTTAIAATSINIICTAETINASTAAPVGMARRGIRFSPIPGSQE